MRGCLTIEVSAVGRAGSRVSLLGGCWAYNRLPDGLRLVVLGNVGICWVESATVCGDGLELVHFWCQVQFIDCSTGGCPFRLCHNVYLIVGG